MGYKLNRHGLFNVRWAWTKSNIKLILSELQICKSPVVHICSGCSNIGDVRLDRVKAVNEGVFKRDHNRKNADVLGNMTQLPLKSNIAMTVLCDPPYDIKPLDHDVFKDLNRELIRILKPGGNLIYIAPWIPASPCLFIQKTIFIPIGNNYKNVFYKILSVSKKEVL